MKVEVKKIDEIRRELKLEIPRERVSEAMEEVFGEIGREARIKGFRPGKAPRHLLEAQYGKLAKDEMIKKLIPQAYREALEKENLEPIDLPEIHDVLFKDGIVSFTAKLDLKPEVIVKNYKSIPVKRKSAQVGEEEINKTLEFFKQGQGKDKEAPLDDHFAKGMGYASLEDFKNSLRRQLEVEKDRHARSEVEQQVVDYLLQHTSFPVPSSIVNRQYEERVADWRHRLEHQGMKKDDIEKRLQEAEKELRQSAERDIRVSLIFQQILTAEGVELGKEDNLFVKTMEILLKEAKWEEAK